jgi:aryl-alcohol dehydrogenase-like predicted oxidoreductase
MDERKKNNEGLRSIMGSGDQTAQEVEISEALSKVAAEHGIESVTTIALAYVRAKVPNVFPIIGGRKIEHLHDNIKALDIKLTTKQLEFLESHTQFDVGFPGNFISNDSHITGKTAPLVAATAHIQFEVDQPFGLAKE